MDFTYLLEIAKMNEQKNKEEKSKFFPSKLSKAKKVERPTPNTDAVKAILDQKQKDIQKKDLKFIKDRKELLDRRSLDKKTNRRVHAMIHRTKGACKSVLDEAKDLITVNGEGQCDEDDYGYESNMSQEIFAKLTTQYKAAPEDDRLMFKKRAKDDMKDIKSRVMDSLKRKHEEDTGVRKRQRSRKSRKPKEEDAFINDGDPYGKSSKASCHKSATPPLPPSGKPVAAEESPPAKKKFRKPAPPPMSFQDLLKVAKKKQKEPAPAPVFELPVKEPSERPLTAKEKVEKEEERQRELRRMGKMQRPVAGAKAVDPPGKQSCSSGDARKVGSAALANGKLAASGDTKKVIDRSKYFAIPGAKPTPAQQPVGSASVTTARKELVQKPVREHPALQKKPAKRPAAVHQRTIDSDESEYDSEMDDFIDDGDMGLDYSSEIKKIFGYDKTKYSNIDDDDDSSMVASYSQMEMEEKRSAKIGMKEDVEDMKREEMDKKRKMARKMQLEKSLRRK